MSPSALLLISPTSKQPPCKSTLKAIKAGEEAVRDARLRYTAECWFPSDAIAIHRWNLARAGLERQTGMQDHQASGSNKLLDWFN